MAFEGIQFFLTTMFNKWFLDILKDKHISGKCNVVPAIFVNFQMQVSPSINPSIHPSIHSSMDPSIPPYLLHICITYAYIYTHLHDLFMNIVTCPILHIVQSMLSPFIALLCHVPVPAISVAGPWSWTRAPSHPLWRHPPGSPSQRRWRAQCVPRRRWTTPDVRIWGTSWNSRHFS